MTARTACVAQSHHGVPPAAEANSGPGRNYPGFLATLGFAVFFGFRPSMGRDRAEPWIDQHLRCRFQHLHQFQHRAANHYQWNCFATCCLLYDGTRNTTSDYYRHNRYALSSCNRGGSRPRLGESAWSTLYISRRWRGCFRHGNYRGSAWNHPSRLLFQWWRNECNAIHDSDPQWRRRLYLQARGALNTGANSMVILAGGACASDVFWAPVGATTLGANAALSPTPTFVGNILDAAGITIGHFANLTGRALAFGGTVTTDADTITVPTCTPFAGGGTTIPALSEWAMVMLAGLTAIAGFAAIRRKAS